MPSMTKPIPGAATDAERREALELAQRLESLGREAKVEPFEARPAYPLVYVTLALLAIVGSVASVSLPIAGAALAGVAAILTFGEGTGMFMLARRLTGMRASQNVVSEEDGGKPGTLVLAARYNADRASAQRMRLSPVFFWAMVAVLLCGIGRIAGLDGVALTAV